MRKKYLLREGAIDLFGNSDSFFSFAERSRALRKKKHKLFTIILSFSVEDRLSLSDLKEITLKWLKHFFCGYNLEEVPFSAVVHTDTEHLHIHLTVANFFLPTGSYLYFYNHRTDLTFLNQLNRYIEEKYGLTPAFERSKPISFPHLLLSKRKKGETTEEEEKFITFLENLTRTIEQGFFTNLEELLEFLKRKRKTFEFLYHRELKEIPLGEVGFKVGNNIIKVRGLALHSLFFSSDKKKRRKYEQLFFFDKDLFLKSYRKRFFRIYRRRKGSLRRLKLKGLKGLFYLKNKHYFNFVDLYLRDLERESKRKLKEVQPLEEPKI